MSFISLITILCVGSDRPVVHSTHPSRIITIPSVVVQHELHHDTRRYSHRALLVLACNVNVITTIAIRSAARTRYTAFCGSDCCSIRFWKMTVRPL
ncbi:hypothetical protein K523DRAFT_326566 [Schizophyllum commune Tattone D]|nr:hypothetical protein K523DRAFT_326566 [Schizophyllum commune Tattone D]